ncbi:MAG: hypothetical protein KKB20_04965 [Proteobacteria bacterium]|nr:hypothetical protein [Pseudomonadota bacterium]
MKRILVKALAGLWLIAALTLWPPAGPFSPAAEAGPHGGRMLAVDGQTYFLELVHDPGRGQLTIYPLTVKDGEVQGLPRRRRQVYVTIPTADGPVSLHPFGKRTRSLEFVITHEALKTTPLKGDIHFICPTDSGEKPFTIPMEPPPAR